MASLDETGQWIVMLGFIVSIILVFLALIVNQSALIGKTTSESVMEFPKSDIQDLRAEVREYSIDGSIEDDNLSKDLQSISLARKGIIFYFSTDPYGYSLNYNISLHYNDGLTEYNEKSWGGL
jgi:hypothetical protein